jgi:ArsR family transcriptional regulator
MDIEQKVLAESQAALCSVFANPKRIQILWTLVDQEKSVGEIASAVGASLQSTSQHLRLMREKGLLRARRDGQTIYYTIDENEETVKCPLLIAQRPRILI